MNKIEELEKQAKSILEEIEKLKKEEKVESKVWKPKENETYFVICLDGEVGESVWENTEIDEKLYEIGNCFNTYKEAEKAVEKAKIYTQLKRLAEEINTEPIDWENREQTKYYIGIDLTSNKLHQYWGSIVKEFGQIYCTNKNFLDIALERIGEENLLKLFKE